MINADDVRKLAKEENVRYLRMTFSDGLGALKNIEIPIALLDDALKGSFQSKMPTCTFTQIQTPGRFTHG